jgi:hypothetical protein
MHIFRYLRTCFGNFQKNRRDTSAPTRTLLTKMVCSRYNVLCTCTKTFEWRWMSRSWFDPRLQTYAYARRLIELMISDLLVLRNESPVHSIQDNWLKSTCNKHPNICEDGLNINPSQTPRHEYSAIKLTILTSHPIYKQKQSFDTKNHPLPHRLLPTNQNSQTCQESLKREQEASVYLALCTSAGSVPDHHLERLHV